MLFIGTDYNKEDVDSVPREPTLCLQELKLSQATGWSTEEIDLNDWIRSTYNSTYVSSRRCDPLERLLECASSDTYCRFVLPNGLAMMFPWNLEMENTSAITVAHKWNDSSMQVMELSISPTGTRYPKAAVHRLW
mmetsp:Transcript_24270/g.38141  ORF Transcript_24270/g.38141 Transcript_24270/m.38141 type:complete len:135 (+) Transcript_24270:436-840(+)